MIKTKRAAKQVIARAISAKGSIELDQVVEYIVEHYYQKVSSRKNVRKNEVPTEVFKAIERIGFETTRDVQRAIDELMMKERLAG
jgi:hypothetical protein